MLMFFVFFVCFFAPRTLLIFFMLQAFSKNSTDPVPEASVGTARGLPTPAEGTNGGSHSSVLQRLEELAKVRAALALVSLGASHGVPEQKYWQYWYLLSYIQYQVVFFRFFCCVFFLSFLFLALALVVCFLGLRLNFVL